MTSLNSQITSLNVMMMIIFQKKHHLKDFCPRFSKNVTRVLFYVLRLSLGTKKFSLLPKILTVGVFNHSSANNWCYLFSIVSY